MRTLHVNHKTKFNGVQQPLKCGCWVDGIGTKSQPYTVRFCDAHRQVRKALARVVDAKWGYDVTQDRREWNRLEKAVDAAQELLEATA